MTKEMIRQIENDYWEEKADPIDMTEVFDLASKALEQQPCEDCISREDILDAIETWDKFGVNAEQKLIRWQDHYVPYVHLDDVRNAIANMPSVTPTRPKGKWIQTKDDCDGVNFYDFSFECSKCGKELSFKSNFCPNCGADMRGEEENE